jgi:translation initiation factor IF-2
MPRRGAPGANAGGRYPPGPSRAGGGRRRRPSRRVDPRDVAAQVPRPGRPRRRRSPDRAPRDRPRLVRPARSDGHARRGVPARRDGRPVRRRAGRGPVPGPGPPPHRGAARHPAAARPRLRPPPRAGAPAPAVGSSPARRRPRRVHPRRVPQPLPGPGLPRAGRILDRHHGGLARPGARRHGGGHHVPQPDRRRHHHPLVGRRPAVPDPDQPRLVQAGRPRGRGGGAHGGGAVLPLHRARSPAGWRGGRHPRRARHGGPALGPGLAAGGDVPRG